MIQYTQYVGRLQDFRGELGGLPPWARVIVGILAIPGLILLALSVLAFLVSLSALLVLTVPAYGLLSRITGKAATGVRRVEATIIE